MSTLRRLVLAWLIGLVGLGIVAVQPAVPVESLLLDASVVGGGHWYGGLVTSLVVFGWTVSAVSLGFASYCCRLAGRSSAAQAIGTGSLIVAVLLFDDLFQLHTAVVPYLVGGPKWVLVLGEGAAVAYWSIRWISEIARTRWELLVAAAFCFSGSLFVDGLALRGNHFALLAEDGAKALGVLSLATWAVSTAADLVQSLAAQSESVAPPAIPAAEPARSTTLTASD